MTVSLLLSLSALLSAAQAGPVRLDRVEVLSLDPGGFLTQELPLAGVRPMGTAGQWLLQVQPVLAVKDLPLTVGVSVAAQSVAWEQPVGPLTTALGVQTRLGLPVGAFAGVAGDLGPVRLGAGGSYRSLATWAYLDGFADWALYPGVEVAWVFRQRAP